ncbi:MAG TPA: acyl-CoA dehydrogenase family protein [Solirubrobacteraceae bacterium]|nr:acyl-CoA dehydrogenase family protein [Solirubrobacteraceae bacterium]
MSSTSQKDTAAQGPPEADLTPDQLIARAIALRPKLIAAQAEAEERTYYSEEMHQELLDSGFYRLYIPRRYGGYEFDANTYMRVLIELARGCVSTAWCAGLAAAHALQIASWWEEPAQAEIFGDGDFRAASVAAPIGPARRTGEEWELNGKVGYCSGIPYSTHYMGQALIAGDDGTPTDRMLLFVAPRSEFTVLDDWGDLLGLKGSGSQSITFKDGMIPAHWGLEDKLMVDMDVSNGTPGLRLHNNPLYGGRALACFTMSLGAIMVGAAYQALDEYELMLDSKLTHLPPMQPRRFDPDFQRWFGSALAKVATAEAALLNCADQHMELCAAAAQGARYTYGDDMRLGCIAREVMIQTWEIMQSEIFRTAGSSAGAKGQRLERIYRDMSIGNSHRNTMLREWAFGELAREHLGLPRLGPGNVQPVRR